MNALDETSVGVYVMHIEAIRYRPDLCNCAAVGAFLGYDWDERECVELEDAHESAPWQVPTNRGTVEADPGDWIVKDADGSFFVVTNDKFQFARAAGERS